MSTKRFIIMFLCVLVICVLAGSTVVADTVIPYSLNNGWSYEEGYPGTLELTEYPAGGIIASINLTIGIDDGGLVASNHDLPDFSLNNDGFIQLEYSSLSSEITDNSEGPDLCLEIQFYDAGEDFYEMAVAVSQVSEGFYFETWFESRFGSIISDSYFQMPFPDGLSVAEGALGLYSDGLLVQPYFIDAAGSVSYLFDPWDVSAITGTRDYSVDNDFEGTTTDGGTIVASVNLERVVYGLGTPPPKEPISDHVLKIEMSTTYNYDYPEVPLHYEFDAWIQVDSTVVSGSMMAPDESEYEMIYESDGADSWFGVNFDNSDPSFLDNFGAGTYTFTVNYEDGSSDSTSIDYQLPGGGQIPYVTQEPHIIYPQHDDIDVPLQCTFQFDPAIDPEHTIGVWVEPVDTMSGALTYNMEGLPYNTALYGPVALSPMTLYEGGYSINYAVNMTNADGIPVVMDTDAETQIHFTTASSVVEDDLDIDWICMTSSMAHSDGIADALPWMLEIWVYLVDPGTLDHIDITAPGDTEPFVTLTEDGPVRWGDFNSYHHPTLESLRSEFPEGIYIFEFYNSSGILLKTIELDYSDFPSGPTGPVSITYPTHLAADVSTNPTISWTPSPGDVGALIMSVEDEVTDVDIYKQVISSDSGTSWTPGPLQPDNQYDLAISACTVKNWSGAEWPTDTVGDDTFSYLLMTEYLNEIVFTTALPSTDPIEEIEEIINLVDESVEDGTLTGNGPGNSADNRLNALRNKLEEAQSLIEAGLYEEACDQLWSTYRKCDGDPRPPDFVTGEAADDLADMILVMMGGLGC